MIKIQPFAVVYILKFCFKEGQRVAALEIRFRRALSQAKAPA